jgi:hypothetical protein
MSHRNSNADLETEGDNNENEDDNNENEDRASITTSELANIEWTEDHEKILIEWADKAMCYRWLHSKSHANYRRKNTLFTIPVIIMSTLAGTANFAQDRVSTDIKPWFAMGIGAVNLVAGILTTIQQFLKVSELNEAHRVASIAWDKFYRNTKVELAKAPTERLPVLQMLKHAKEEFDRLMETSPSISDKVILLFKNTFSDGIEKAEQKALQLGEEISLTNRQKAYNDLRKPEICDTLETTRHYVYQRKPPSKKKNTLNAIGLARQAIDLKHKQQKVEEIISQYMNTKQRMPTTLEILDELEGYISSNIVEKIVTDYNTNNLNKETNEDNDHITVNITDDNL